MDDLRKVLAMESDKAVDQDKAGGFGLVVCLSLGLAFGAVSGQTTLGMVVGSSIGMLICVVVGVLSGQAKVG